MLERLEELRETSYLLDFRFVMKDTTQKQPDGRDAQDRVGGGTQSFHALALAPNLHKFSDLGTPSFGVLTEAAF